MNLNRPFSQDTVEVVSAGRQSYEVTIPNCKATQGDDLKFRIACQKVGNQKVIQFSVMRGSELRPSAHGILGKDGQWLAISLYACVLYITGQFWNIPIDVVEYAGNYCKLVNSTFLVAVNHPDPNSPPRSFIAEQHPATWDGKRMQCLYAGNAQGGPINEVDIPNDYVIEGTYKDYEISGLFGSDFRYSQFADDQCV